VQSLWDLFNSIVSWGTPHLRILQGGYKLYTFSTFTLLFFTALHKQWYSIKEGGSKAVKVLPDNIGAFNPPLLFAYWISGDGYYKRMLE
jgi:hypothetical protein